jgi:long-chain acyl-CoA synthetase
MLKRPGLNVVDCIHLNAKFRGTHTAFVCNDQRVNWKEFNQQTNRVANALIKAGLKKGDKVSLVCLSSIEAAAVLFGTMRAGGVIVPLSLLLTPDQIVSLTKDAGSKFFFVFSPLESLINPILDQLELIPKESRVAVGFKDEQYAAFSTFLAGVSDEVPDVILNDDDEACIIYSSGTTGMPKGIIHTHLSRTLFALSMVIGTDALEPNAKTIATTPLFANTSWGTIMPTMLAGATTILMPMFTPGDFLETVQKERGTVTLMVPTQYQAVINHPDLDKYDLSSLRFLACAGATLPLPLKKRIIEKFGNILMEAYGVTEGVATGIPPEFVMEKPTSVGIPIFGADIRIINDEGTELSAGEVGEIVGYSHWFMKGYHNNPEATAEMIWHDKRGRTFIRTGDMGYLDNDGFLYIVDRKKDMIVSGGLNVFAIDIENILRKHEDVNDTAVIAVPHEKWGETPLALVILKEGATSTEGQIKEWSNAQLAKHQRISTVEFREEDFPRNVLGKILKRVLREPYWKD